MGNDQQIFKESSVAALGSALFFPGHIREDMMRLYNFLRVADDYVDETPQQLGKLRDLITKWQDFSERPIRDLEIEEGDDENTRVIKNICRLKIIYGFDTEWIDAFLASMLMNANPKKYDTLNEALVYVYGSAEVVGLMIASILRLPKDVMAAAAMQGRALQWIHFLRDMTEDNTSKRCYLPQEDLRQFKLKDLSEEEAHRKPNAFAAFMRFQVLRYRTWQAEANAGIKYIPKRPRIAVQTAADSYAWIAKQIEKHPLAVFERTIAPSNARTAGTVLTHLFD